MEILLRDIDRFKIVDVEGNVNQRGASQLEGMLNSLLDHGHPDLVVHFLGTDYVSSFTIGMLVRTWKRLLDTEGTIAVISPIPPLTGLLHECGIGRIMPVFPSEQTFRAAITQKRQEPKIKTRSRGAFQVIHIEKTLSVLSGYKELDQEIGKLVHSGHKAIAVHMGKGFSVYSEIAGLFTKWARIMEKEGAKLYLIGLEPKVQVWLSSPQAGRSIVFCDSEDDLNSK